MGRTANHRRVIVFTKDVLTGGGLRIGQV